MDYSYILRSAKAKPGTFAEFGFNICSSETENKKSAYKLKRDLLSTDFYAEFFLDLASGTLEAHVYEKSTGERYALFDYSRAAGSFVAELREKVQLIVDDFRDKCLEAENLRDKYVSWMEKHFDCKADFPWDDMSDACVFRCTSKKWFALVMKIKYSQLGLTGDEFVFIVNLKAAPEKIAKELIDRKSVFPSYHMNKKYWITVLLTSVTSFEDLCKLTEESYALVSKGKKSK